MTGVVSGYREGVSRAGNPYTTFRLAEGGSGVAVFAGGHRGLRDDIRVRVSGVFQKVRRVARYTFYNEIEAERWSRCGKELAGSGPRHEGQGPKRSRGQHRPG
ncbi:MAG: hypothetical protein RMM30_11360 [Armatimonadota bacterium]|nr:hypothetical protein [Armatimonadota bacterium]MDW8157168.1 hypothetical protein [Armatimonadota bacterium]